MSCALCREGHFGAVEGSPSPTCSGQCDPGLDCPAGSTSATGAAQLPTWPLPDPHARPWAVAWGRNGSSGDCGNAVVVTSVGVFVGGATAASPDLGTMDTDLLVLRLSPRDGAVVWSRTWGGNGSDAAAALAVGEDSVFVAGNTTAPGSGPSDPNPDAVVVCVNSTDGRALWSRTWGGSASEQATAVTLSGPFLFVAGVTTSFGAGTADGFLLKLNASDGALVWARSWGGGSGDSIRGCVVVAGSVFLAGGTQSFGAGGEDALVLRLSADTGALTWSRVWGGAGEETATAVAASSSSTDVFVVGHASSPTLSSGGGVDAAILRLTPAGKVVWAQAWGGSGSEFALGVTLVDADVFVVGCTDSFGTGVSEVLVLRMQAATGQVVWSRVWGGPGPDVGLGVSPLGTGALLVTGTTGSMGLGLQDAVAFTVSMDGVVAGTGVVGATMQGTLVARPSTSVSKAVTVPLKPSVVIAIPTPGVGDLGVLGTTPTLPVTNASLTRACATFMDRPLRNVSLQVQTVHALPASLCDRLCHAVTITASPVWPLPNVSLCVRAALLLSCYSLAVALPCTYNHTVTTGGPSPRVLLCSAPQRPVRRHRVCLPI